MNSPDLDLCLAVADANARMSQAIEDTLAAWHGLSLADFRLLLALQDAPNGGQTPAQLAIDLTLSRSSVVRMVLPLEKLGWLERAGGSLALTAVGQRRIGEAVIDAGRVAHKALRSLAADDRQLLQGLLGRIAPSAARSPAAAIAP